MATKGREGLAAALFQKDVLFCNFEILVMHVADGYGVATEVHHEATVAQDAHDIAFLSGKDACEHTELHVVACELYERVAQECHALRLRLHHFHERLHHTVVDGSGLARHAVVHKMILREILLQETPQFRRRSLQEHETAHRGFLLLLHAFAIGLLPVVDGAVDEALGYEVPLEAVALEESFEFFGCKMLYEKIAPGRLCFFVKGYFFYFLNRFFISPNYVDALW